METTVHASSNLLTTAEMTMLVQQVKNAITTPLPGDVPPGWDKLKPREQLTLRLIAQGLTTKQIADRYCRSESAVVDIRRRLSEKLDQEGCHNLLRFAMQYHTFLCEQ